MCLSITGGELSLSALLETRTSTTLGYMCCHCTTIVESVWRAVWILIIQFANFYLKLGVLCHGCEWRQQSRARLQWQQRQCICPSDTAFN